MGKIYTSVEQLIGGTPLLELTGSPNRRASKPPSWPNWNI